MKKVHRVNDSQNDSQSIFITRFDLVNLLIPLVGTYLDVSLMAPGSARYLAVDNALLRVRRYRWRRVDVHESGRCTILGAFIVSLPPASGPCIASFQKMPIFGADIRLSDLNRTRQRSTALVRARFRAAATVVIWDLLARRHLPYNIGISTRLQRKVPFTT